MMKVGLKNWILIRKAKIMFIPYRTYVVTPVPRSNRNIHKTKLVQMS